MMTEGVLQESAARRSLGLRGRTRIRWDRLLILAVLLSLWTVLARLAL
jgi:hypothetical protein